MNGESNKKVSVIMGVYNSNYVKLERAIKSILNQTYKNLELVICNDSSTNGIDKYLNALNDNRIIVLSNEKNKGLAYSLNRCIENATGEYIARMDDDDISDKTRIEKEVDFLNRNPEYDIVGTGIWLIDGDKVWGKDTMKEYPSKEDLLFGVVHVHPTIMVRKSAYERVGGYRALKKTRRTEDYDLYMRMYASGSKGYNIQENLFYYTQSFETLSKRKFNHRIDEVLCRYEGFKALNLYPKGYVYLLKPILSGLIPNVIKQKLIKERLKIDKEMLI